MKFYVMDISFSEKFASAKRIEPVNQIYPPKCNRCGTYISNMIWKSPFNIELDKRDMGDFIYGGFTNIIVSERFKKYFEKSELKGIDEFYRINILKLKRKYNPTDISNYYTFDIKIDRKTEFDKKKSKLQYKEWNVCKDCGNGTIKNLDGIYIIEETWSGLDIFYLYKLYGFLIVSERFVNFVKEMNLTNTDFIEATKYIPGYLEYI